MCKIEKCSRKVRRSGLCGEHYAEKRGIKCKVKSCNKFSVGKELCSLHWQRDKAGIPLDYVKETGKTYISSDGYVVEYMPGHIQSDKYGKVLQHRRLMSDKMGRKLNSYENIHHINGDKKDNRLENLEIWITKQPKGQRISDLIEWSKWILKEYNDE